jgi:hypothetical protein
MGDLLGDRRADLAPVQEWINPGYLARSERRQRDQQGTQFWVSPAKTDQWLTGKRASPF